MGWGCLVRVLDSTEQATSILLNFGLPEPKNPNIGALILRKVFEGTLYYKQNKEPLFGTELGPYTVFRHLYVGYKTVYSKS